MPSSIEVVARPASAIATSGSPATVLAYHRDIKPSASAAWACSTILSVDDAPPVSPIRIATLQTFCTSTDKRASDRVRHSWIRACSLYSVIGRARPWLSHTDCNRSSVSSKPGPRRLPGVKSAGRLRMP